MIKLFIKQVSHWGNKYKTCCCIKEKLILMQFMNKRGYIKTNWIMNK